MAAKNKKKMTKMTKTMAIDSVAGIVVSLFDKDASVMHL